MAEEEEKLAGVEIEVAEVVELFRVHREEDEKRETARREEAERARERGGRMPNGAEGGGRGKGIRRNVGRRQETQGCQERTVLPNWRC